MIPEWRNKNLFFGPIPQDVIDHINNIPIGGKNAYEWQCFVAKKMQDIGFDTSLEFPVRYWNRNGRVDILAICSKFEIAIECDYRSCRLNSIEKVKQFETGCVILRDPKRLTIL